jgi:hypothetical protein
MIILTAFNMSGAGCRLHVAGWAFIVQRSTFRIMRFEGSKLLRALE